MKGNLDVITGPMFSGKSEELLRRIRRAQIANQPVLAFKPKIETRSLGIFTHSGMSFHFPVHSIEYPNEIFDEIKGNEIICIEEAQFFEDYDIVTVVQKLVDNGHRVIVTGLDQTYRQEPFGFMPELLSLADFIVKLRAICVKCGEDATTTQRLVNGEPASYEGETILVGAKDSYEARCRNCHERG